MIHVIIFEDNKHLRETFQLLLDTDHNFNCVGAYSDCRNLAAILEANPCDIVLMDIEMPGINGIEATKIIKESFPEVQVLIQTVFFEDEYIFNAIRAGAAGYILKTTSPQGYLQSIEEVYNGGSPITPGIARKVLQHFNPGLQSNHVSKDVHNLTAQEKKVLQLLVTGKSYKMIAAELFIVKDTVKTHIRSIYYKLQVHSGTEAVSKAIRDHIV